MSSFNLVFRICTPDGDAEQPVYFKTDGNRFDQDKTIKFITNGSYKFSIQTKPLHRIRQISIMGKKIEDFEEKTDTQANISTTFAWSTKDMESTKKGARKHLDIIIEFDKGSLELSLQAKIYSQKDEQHLRWGTALHYIEYKCKLKGDSQIFEVVDTTYR